MGNEGKLFFLQDRSFGDSRQVYSGHSGKGKNFRMNQGDYGKYAMKPRSYEDCWKLAGKIEVDATNSKGELTFDFKWKVVPMTEIELCNFRTQEEQEAYDKLLEEQRLIK